MLTVDNMIKRVRTICHDTEEIEYTDVFILDCLNDAVRIIRRTAMDINPEVIMATFTGNTTKKEIEEDIIYGLELDEVEDWMPADDEEPEPEEYYDTVTFDHPIGKLVQVTIDGKVIEGISLEALHDITPTGRPQFYRMIGFDKMQFYPIPDKKYQYTITYVDDMTLLEEGGKSPFPNIIDDLMIEYAGLRTSISNEFDVQQEQQLIATFVGQIENVIAKVVPQDVMVAGYWNGGYKRSRW